MLECIFRLQECRCNLLRNAAPCDKLAPHALGSAEQWGLHARQHLPV